MSNNKNLTNINTKVSPQVHAVLMFVAKSEGKNISQLLEDALMSYIKNNTKYSDILDLAEGREHKAKSSVNR
jgi:hypothetical protein